MLYQSSLEVWALWTPFYDRLRNLLYGTMLWNAGHPMVPSRSDMQVDVVASFHVGVYNYQQPCRWHCYCCTAGHGTVE
jgi:hypothetical protein